MAGRGVRQVSGWWVCECLRVASQIAFAQVATSITGLSGADDPARGLVECFVNCNLGESTRRGASNLLTNTPPRTVAAQGNRASAEGRGCASTWQSTTR